MDFDDFDSGFGSGYDYSSNFDGGMGAADAGLAVGALGIGMTLIIGFVSLVLIVFQFYVFARIIGKMGFSPWLVLLNLIPIAGLVLIIYFAFVEWPIEKELKKLKGGKE